MGGKRDSYHGPKKTMALTIVQLGGSSRMLETLSPSAPLSRLYSEVGDLLGIDPNELVLAIGSQPLSKDTEQTLDAAGINSQCVVTAVQVCQQPRMLWRGFRLRTSSGRFDPKISFHERQQRLLLDSTGACFLVSLDRRSQGFAMNDSIHENSEMLQWDFMRGTWHRQAGSSVHCHWEKHLRRRICEAGSDDFFGMHLRRVRELPPGTLCGTWEYSGGRFCINEIGSKLMFHEVIQRPLQLGRGSETFTIEDELTPDGEWYVAQLRHNYPRPEAAWHSEESVSEDEDNLWGVIRCRSVENGVERQFKEVHDERWTQPNCTRSSPWPSGLSSNHNNITVARQYSEWEASDPAWSGFSEWEEKDPNACAELQHVQLPVSLGDEWHDFDKESAAHILEEEAESLQAFGADATCINTDCFLGLKTPDSEFSLYDGYYDEAVISCDGLNFLDLGEVGESLVQSYKEKLFIGQENIHAFHRVGFIDYTTTVMNEATGSLADTGLGSGCAT